VNAAKNATSVPLVFTKRQLGNKIAEIVQSEK
jgi:hypothetical protein